MKTLDIDQLYDAQFANVPDGEEYSNFSFTDVLKNIGVFKNVFPKYTILGKALGSTNPGKKHHKKHHKEHKPQPVIVQAPPKPEKKDHTKMYMIGGGVLLLVIVLVLVFTHKK